MIKDKIVKVFDTDNLKAGDLIAFTHTKVGDNGVRGNGQWMFGVLKYVSEEGIEVAIHNRYISIFISDIESDRVRILSRFHKDVYMLLGKGIREEDYLKV